MFSLDATLSTHTRILFLAIVSHIAWTRLLWSKARAEPFLTDASADLLSDQMCTFWPSSCSAKLDNPDQAANACNHSTGSECTERYAENLKAHDLDVVASNV